MGVEDFNRNIMERSQAPCPTTMTPWDLAIAMFYAPGTAFAQLATKRHTWFPLVLLMLSSCIITFWYFSVVDQGWLHEQTMVASTDTARAHADSATMSDSTTRLVGSAGAAIAMPIMFALFGLYFLVVGNITDRQIGFKSGFSLLAWSSLPFLLEFPLAAMQLLLASSDQFTFESLNPSTLNQLIVQLDQAHPMASVLESLSVASVWSMVLMVLGYQTWVKVSRAHALAVVLVPYALSYGVWVAYALSQAA